jgi:reprolysin-like metallo-peptidase family M12B/all-beta uncharacterized protein/S-layer family protein
MQSNLSSKTSHLNSNHLRLALAVTCLVAVAAMICASGALARINAESSSQAQILRTGLWQEIDEASVAPNSQKTITSLSSKTFALDKDALGQLLASAPKEFSRVARSSPLIVTLPLPDGALARFSVEESPMMEPELAAQFPQIKTYRGQGIDDPWATTRFDWTPEGFHAIVLSNTGPVYVVPYAKGDTTNYISYNTRDLSEGSFSFECGVTEADVADAVARGVYSHGFQKPAPNFVSGATLRNYRLAVAATGEYTAAYGGGSQANTLSAITTTANLIDAIYERDASIRLTLIANETAIIFTDPVTDGYTHGSTGTLIGENQTKLDAVIGSGAYDIGFVFDGNAGSMTSGGFSGLAFVGVVCATGNKARGAAIMTGLTASHSLFVNGIAHEFGHEFSATHSFNGTTGICSGQRTGVSGYEPGSGSTLMGYSVCGAESLQPTNDGYFHTGSLEQIVSYTTGSGAGNTCDTETATGNSPPVVNAGLDYTIPKGTPFTLTATATDANGDALNYCWEEYDLSVAAPPDNDADGQPRPIMRSLAPVTSPSRTFPRLQYILNNANVPPQTYTIGSNTYLTGEILPAITRTMKFHVTVRDNRAGGGGVASDEMLLNVRSESGPFAVTQPNSALTWTTGTHQTVTWNVAGTSASPIDTANVRISLSTDGGNTFPIVLAANTPNDGSEDVTVPNTPTTTARIKVEALANIFFDISDANVTIAAGCPAFLTPFVQSFPANGGTDMITVSAGATCAWLATTTATWITINSGAGTGGGTINYTVGANPSTTSNRSGTITVAGLTFTVAQGAAFLDVPTTNPFYNDIGKLSARGITVGCNSNNYCPNAPVTREQMAVFIVRALGEFDPVTPASQRFNDVPPTSLFYNFIDRLAALQITLGCQVSPPLYCPSDPVKREQMAAFIIRALGEFDPPTPTSQRFIDVPPTNVFYNFIDRMAVLNITLGCTPDHTLYCPNDSVTRAQMAAFLVRAFNL